VKLTEAESIFTNNGFLLAKAGAWSWIVMRKGGGMQKEQLGIDELIDNLNIFLKKSPQLMAKLISFCKWIEVINKDLPNEKKVVFYKREDDNIGFTIEIKMNKINKANFLVIKFNNTDRDYKYFHLDIYLGKDGYPSLGNSIYPRKSNKAKTRWIIDEKTYIKIDNEEWKSIIKLAYNKRYVGWALPTNSSE
jgi:hypothetical protein